MNYIELPADSMGSRRCTNSQATVIEAEELGDYALKVVGPKNFANKHLILIPREWTTIEHDIGPLSEEEWCSLICEKFSDTWMSRAATYRTYFKEK